MNDFSRSPLDVAQDTGKLLVCRLLVCPPELPSLKIIIWFSSSLQGVRQFVKVLVWRHTVRRCQYFCIIRCHPGIAGFDAPEPVASEFYCSLLLLGVNILEFNRNCQLIEHWDST
jgi:hypothetical protein